MSGPTKSTPGRTGGGNHSCVVATEFVRDQVDPRIHQMWALESKTPKFGDLRKIWRQRHCKTLNPYGSDGCPYRPDECALAYLVCASRAARMSRTNPMGYFWTSAKSMAIQRADAKPLAREEHRSGDPGAAQPGVEARPQPVGAAAAAALGAPAVRRVDDPGLRRDVSRPSHIGTVLGTLDLGSHQGRAADGEEGTE